MAMRSLTACEKRSTRVSTCRARCARSSGDVLRGDRARSAALLRLDAKGLVSSEWHRGHRHHACRPRTCDELLQLCGMCWRNLAVQRLIPRTDLPNCMAVRAAA